MSGFESDAIDGSLLTDFLDEAGQLVDRLNADLLTLDELTRAAGDEPAACDLDLLNGMFRSAHSIKGLSAMLGLSTINRLTHRIENVLDAARKNQLPIVGDVVQTVFQGVDALSALIERLRAEGDDSEDVTAVVEQIQALLENSGCKKETTTQADAERALAELTNAPSHAEPIVELKPTLPAPVLDASAPSESRLAEYVDLFGAMTDESDVPTKYLGIFIDEAEQSLDELSEILSGADVSSNPGASEPLMITAHRIKGSAASLGLNRAAKLAHLMEDELQLLRDRGAAPSPPMVDSLLVAVDALRDFVAGMKKGESRTAGFAAAAASLVDATHALAQTVATPPTPPIAAPSAASTPIDFRALVAAPGAWTGRIVYGMATFAPNAPLSPLKAQLLLEKLQAIAGAVASDPKADALESLETVERLVFAMPSSIEESDLRSRLNVAGVARIDLEVREETADAQGSREANGSPAAPSSKGVAAEAKAGEESKTKRPTEPAKVAEPAKGGDSTKAAEAAKPTETLRVDIERLDELMNLAGQLVINRARLNRLGTQIRDTMPRKALTSSIADAHALAERIRTEVGRKSEGNNIDVGAMESQLARLAGDLAAIQSEMARFNEMRAGVNDLFEAVHQLERVTDGIQKSVMDTRMVPIGPLFTRFKRVIRDITRGNGKEVELVVRGEKTELDKRMIDELGDPLIHMVRNSADHGIESPDIREQIGKPRHGTVTLDAFHRGNNIVIQVSDDGKGLDRMRILAKAIERGLIAEAEAERLTPQQTFALIWEPGFSTAEKVTEISGRGMGMDIVRSKIEGLSGKVEVDSVPGQGTTFTIKLPLTMAILPSLMAEHAGEVFALPMESIVEIVDSKSYPIKTVQGVATTVIRGRVVSVVGFDDLFVWNRPSSRVCDASDRAIVVLIHEGREIGLTVDRVLGEEDVVIKSLAENYHNVEGVAGASILGDGRVSLILDVPKLIEIAAQTQVAGN